MKQVLARVRDIRQTEPGSKRSQRDVLGVYLMQLRCPEISREAKPGQFVMMECGQTLPRPLSINHVDKDGISLYFAALEDGKGTGWLSQRKVDDDVKLFGPLGNGFIINSNSKSLLLVGGGMGIAPLVFLARQASQQGLSVTLLYGTASKDQYPADLFPSGIKLVRATEDGSIGQRGRVTDLLAEHISEADQSFACGPLPMYRAIAGNPRLKNKPVQVSLEVRMGCGVGVCYGCTIRTKQGLKQVCQDGPVFHLNDIIWEEVVC